MFNVQGFKSSKLNGLNGYAVSIETQNFASVKTAVSLLALKNGIYYEHISR